MLCLKDGLGLQRHKTTSCKPDSRKSQVVKRRKKGTLFKSGTVNKAGDLWEPNRKKTKRKNKDKAKKDKRAKKATDTRWRCPDCKNANKATHHTKDELCLTKLFKDKNVTSKALQREYLTDYLALKKSLKDPKAVEKAFRPTVMCVDVAPTPGDDLITESVRDLIKSEDREVRWSDEN